MGSPNPSHGSFDQILAGATPELAAIARSLRAAIRALHPGAVEIIWPRQRIASFGVGPKKMSEHYAYVAVLGAHVNLGLYHGAALADPDRLLEGTGKKLRHIKIRTIVQARSAGVAALLRHAIRDRARRAKPR